MEVQPKCAFCKQPAAKACPKCLTEYYCGRECQLKDWSRHKRNCFTAEQRQYLLTKMTGELFERVCKCIAGNVIIMNAWYGGESIEVNINESLADFEARGVHFLHLRACESPPNSTSECKIIFKLDDYKHESTIRIGLPAGKIREKHKKPTAEWSLMYDLS